jgi:hypothetical protein
MNRSAVYSLYEALWPLETDLFQLLPKPDGIPRAVYTGAIHPTTITEFALGASLYFGQLIVETPFVHAGTFKKEFSPVENPRAYRQEFLKTVLFFFNVMPLVEPGSRNIVQIPQCCHLIEVFLELAKSLGGSRFSALVVHSLVLGAYDPRNSSGSLAIFAAIRHASSRVSSLGQCPLYP